LKIEGFYIRKKGVLNKKFGVRSREFGEKPSTHYLKPREKRS